MPFTFVGDVHGKTEGLVKKIRASEGEKFFQIGDMGLGFKGVLLPHFERDRLLFIRGNHDSPSFCRAHPNYAGDYGYLEDEKLFFLGGAWSIDWKWRTEGISWWVDEELSHDELAAAIHVYTRSKPEIVVTHEAPTRAAEILINQMTLRVTNPENPTSVLHDPSYSYYKAKLGCVNTRTSQALQQMLDNWGPKHWVFGHYHVRMDFELQGCKFHCVPELESYKLPEEKNEHRDS